MHLPTYPLTTQTSVPCVPGTMISGDEKKLNEIGFLKELDVLETYKANPKWNAVVPGHTCHGQCHHHHRALFMSGPMPRPLHKLTE